MDFNQRGVHPHQSANTPVGTPVSSGGRPSKSKGGKLGRLGLAHFALLISLTLLLLGVAAAFAFVKVDKEARYVAKDNLQAVFLTNGQVYFGDLVNVNDDFLRLSNIYYLRVNQQVQPNQQGSNNANDISLVKLGCELHGPFDEMVINRDQVSFWENLKTDGSVAKAVAEYQKQNPNGQKCDTPAANSSNNSTPTPSPSTNKKP